MLGCSCSWMWLRLILPTRPKKSTGLNAASCIPRTSSGLKFQPETEFRLNGVSGKQTAWGLISIFEQFLSSLGGKTTGNLKTMKHSKTENMFLLKHFGVKESG